MGLGVYWNENPYFTLGISILLWSYLFSGIITWVAERLWSGLDHYPSMIVSSSNLKSSFCFGLNVSPCYLYMHLFPSPMTLYMVGASWLHTIKQEACKLWGLQPFLEFSRWDVTHSLGYSIWIFQFMQSYIVNLMENTFTTLYSPA